MCIGDLIDFDDVHEAISYVILIGSRIDRPAVHGASKNKGLILDYEPRLIDLCKWERKANTIKELVKPLLHPLAAYSGGIKKGI